MLKVTKLNKSYPNFRLKDVSFEIPVGYITGFLGMNGAGKTTTIKSILNITHPDSGLIEFDGLNMEQNELEIKQNVGFMLGAFDYFPKNVIAEISRIYSQFYPNWDEKIYNEYIKKFKIDEQKKVNELSAGMKVKYGLALALSHHAKILLLDEPTSGLDPIARDELLDIFREIIQDGETGILFSTHITSDLDKCADYVLMLKNGEIIANATKDDLIDNHILISGKIEDLTPDLQKRAKGIKKNRFGFTGLIEREKLFKTDKIELEKPNLEDIMVYYNLEAEND